MGLEYTRQLMILGQVPSFGPVILWDDFESLFKWAGAGEGAEVCEKLSTDAYNGTACLHMETRTVGAAANDKVTATRKVHQRPGKRYRVEFLFKITVRANCLNFGVEFKINDGVDAHYIGLRYAGSLDKWEYQNEGATYSDVPGGGMALANAGWHRVSLDFDEHSKKYINMVCDGIEIDLTGILYGTVVDGDPVGANCQLKGESVAATPPVMYVDDFLFMEI
jgi:hypothetical protein